MPNHRLIRRTLLRAALALSMFTAAASPSFADGKLVVFAAASLKNAIDDVNAAWKADTGKAATASYAASSALARQIEGGAPADVFISADLDWMKYLADKNLVAAGTQVQLLGNSLVLVAPRASTVTAQIVPGFALAAILGSGKLAVCDASVPAGKYGKAALDHLGVWPAVEHQVAQAENVRAALKLVAIGEAALGIVYGSDARAEPAVKVVGAFPDDSHPAIIYPAAALADSKNPDAAAYVKFLQSEKARAIFEADGFVVLAKPAN